MTLTPEAAPAAAGDAVRGASPESPPVALYVHVPFCVSRCPYCDFVLVAGREARGPGNRIGAFVEAVRVELRLRADALDARFGRARPALRSLYLGGGTPSLLAPADVASIVELVQARYGLERDGEVTLEVNPGPDERGDARGFRGAGVSRLSIGAQSFDDVELRSLGRRHGGADIADTVQAARRAGFASISLDLLYDVPGQTLDSWARTLEAAIATEPDHISAYALTLDEEAVGSAMPQALADHLPVSRGARGWRQRARVAQDEDRAAAMYDLADDRLAEAGLRWYEISNWARPGQRSRHNLVYWRREPFEAAGPGAHAFDGRTRRWNGPHLGRYVAALVPPDGSAPSLPPGAADPDAVGDGEAEAAILALRTSDGVPAASDDRSSAVQTALAWGLATGLLARIADRLVLTRRGRLLSNELFARLI